ncbi:MAG: hypothetical protein Q8891_15740 [Bacteroidota bacterium]|nr:hypothetical protein [Bacteroidota bacterium]
MDKSVNYIGSVTIMLVSFCLFCTQKNFAQLPTVKISIDKENILIGQQLHYRVETSMPDNTYRLSWFSVPDSFGHFEVITKDKIDSTSSNGNLNFSQVLTLTNFDSGRRVIPPLQFTVSTLDGDSTFDVYTDSIPVNVQYSPLDSIAPFHDIKTIIAVKKEWPWWIWALMGLAVVLLILWIIFLIKFFKKKRETDTLFHSKLSPYDEAMQSLSELEEEQLIQNNKVKEFHTRLTDIFKRYLSRKTNSYQLHLTTDEILFELGKFDIPKDQIGDFASSLRMGNAAKFARYVPPVYENENCFSRVKEMIIFINNLMTKNPGNDI